jgi:hemolysin III
MLVTTDRATLGKMQNPVRGFLHGGAAVASIAGTVVLMGRAPGLAARLSLLVFGTGLIGLFATSSLYHSIPWHITWKRRMQRLDHSMIFVLIAATYTPLAVIVLDGWLRATTLIVTWGIALFGIGQQAFFPRERNTLSVAMHATLGWLAAFLLGPLLDRLGGLPVALIGLGGVLYTIGIVVIATNRPRLWPRVFSHHEVFHLLVVAAAAVHFLVAYEFVAPYAA